MADLNFLEGCFRVRIDGKTEYGFLSSGTEDMFLGAGYFDRGVYHGDRAGCTVKCLPNICACVCVYIYLVELLLLCF